MTSDTSGRTRTELYTWDVDDGDAGHCGVTSERDFAVSSVHNALRSGRSGARGKIRQVGLPPNGGTEYVVLRTIGEAWIDEMSGALIWNA